MGSENRFYKKLEEVEKPKDESSEIETRVKEMLSNSKKKEIKNEIYEEDKVHLMRPVTEGTGTHVTTTKFKQKSPLSCRLDDDLILAMNLLANAKKFLEGDNKACVNQIIALAVKEYVEKPENAAKIKKMQGLQNIK